MTTDTAPRARPWTEREIKLLATDTDATVAARIGRSPKAVEAKRLALKIPPATAHARRWAPRELALLGKISDAAVAARIGCSRQHVISKRRTLGIAPANPHNTPRKFRRRRKAG